MEFFCSCISYKNYLFLLILEVVFKKCPMCKWRIVFHRCQFVRPEQACEKWEEKAKYPAALSSPSLSTPLVTTTEEGMGGERESSGGGERGRRKKWKVKGKALFFLVFSACSWVELLYSLSLTEMPQHPTNAEIELEDSLALTWQCCQLACFHAGFDKFYSKRSSQDVLILSFCKGHQDVSGYTITTVGDLFSIIISWGEHIKVLYSIHNHETQARLRPFLPLRTWDTKKLFIVCQIF